MQKQAAIEVIDEKIALSHVHSKAALKITSGPELPSTAKVNSSIKSKKFAGDILLRFIHTTQVKLNDHSWNRGKPKHITRAECSVHKDVNANPDPGTSFDGTCTNTSNEG